MFSRARGSWLLSKVHRVERWLPGLEGLREGQGAAEGAGVGWTGGMTPDVLQHSSITTANNNQVSVPNYKSECSQHKEMTCDRGTLSIP